MTWGRADENNRNKVHNKSEKVMAPHSSTLAWKIPWTEEPGRLQSLGSRRVRHNWATSLSLFTFMHWRRTWQPTPVFLPGNPRDGEAWWAAVYGVAQSQTRLKQLSSSSSSTTNIMQLNHPETILYSSLWKNYLPPNQSLVPRKVGAHWAKGPPF